MRSTTSTICHQNGSSMYEDIDDFSSSKEKTEKSGWIRGKKSILEKADKTSKGHKKESKLHRASGDGCPVLIDSEAVRYQQPRDDQKRILDGSSLQESF